MYKLERTRGAGAPEVLRRATAEEEFRLRRNQPLNMAPSAPKDRYCQADFFAQLFQKKSIFWGSRKVSLNSVKASYFRDPFWDPSILVPTVRNEAGCYCCRGFDDLIADTQTDTQTRTSYLGTGVAD